jgi:hypothetical protein
VFMDPFIVTNANGSYGKTASKTLLSLMLERFVSIHLSNFVVIKEV